MNIKIEGATCNGCVQSIEKAISNVDGVESVSFSLDTKLAVISGNAPREDIEDAVEMAGFDIVDSDE